LIAEFNFHDDFFILCKVEEFLDVSANATKQLFVFETGYFFGLFGLFQLLVELFVL
jgi:hypothetical protein